MSQTSTFARCKDGQWYKDPVWFGNHAGHDWFICMDDDDPHEIVIEGAVGKDITRQLAVSILNELNISYLIVRPGSICHTQRSVQRCFPQEGFKFDKMKYASSYFFNWNEAPPRPHQPVKATKPKNVYGVMYNYGGPLPERG